MGADRIAKEKAEKAAADKAEADRIAKEKAEKEAIAKAEEEAAAKLKKEMEAELNAAKEELANHIDGTESKLFVVVSQSGKQTKTITIPAGYKCAAEINKSNWDMAGLPHATCGDRFETTVSGDQLTVKRIDAGGLDGHGWGMKLQFRCSDGPVLATCGGNVGGGHGWKKLSTTNIGVRTGVYVDKFSGMG